jgi:hemoglobin
MDNPSQSGDSSLFEQLGGAGAVDDAIGEFYRRVLADELLGPFFAGVDMDKLASMQTEFFTVALGGEGAYAGMTLTEAHRGRGIEQRHLQRFTEHLLETMLAQGMPAEAASEVADRVTLLGQDVLDAGTESG